MAQRLRPYRSRFHRSTTHPFFTRDRTSDLEIFDRHADLVISKLKERFTHGTAVNVQGLLSRYTMDTATELLFGRDVKSPLGQLPYPSTYKIYAPQRYHPSDSFASAFNRARSTPTPARFSQKLGVWLNSGRIRSRLKCRYPTSSSTLSSTQLCREEGFQGSA